MARSTKADQDADRKHAHARLATQRTCTCGAPVLDGQAGSCAPLSARVDTQCLTPSDELAAALTGRPTYAVWPAKDGVELERRGQFHLRTPAGVRTQVVAHHVCGAPLGTAGPCLGSTDADAAGFDDGPPPF